MTQIPPNPDIKVGDIASAKAEIHDLVVIDADDPSSATITNTQTRKFLKESILANEGRATEINNIKGLGTTPWR